MPSALRVLLRRWSNSTPHGSSPLVAFLHVQCVCGLSERYGEETRFRTDFCRAGCAIPTCELTNHEEDIHGFSGKNALPAWLALQTLPDNDRWLLERIILRRRPEVRLACELEGVEPGHDQPA